MPELFDLRNDYHSDKLDEENSPENPFNLFENWLKMAINTKIDEPNAMILSTCTKQNKPSSRVVLLKHYDNRGFTFFTNYKSRKGNQINENPFGSLLFFWGKLHKQIRIEGKIIKTNDSLSEQYFYKRPSESRISAVISPQSEVIKSRNVLEQKYKKVQIKGEEVKRPIFWGGYTLIPEYFEFWQGRKGRLHDRISYSLSKYKWDKYRLAP